MIYECEQCKGTGYLPKGQRCPCREEDDKAEVLRKGMRVISGSKEPSWIDKDGAVTQDGGMHWTCQKKP